MRFIKKYTSISKNVESSMNKNWTQLLVGKSSVLDTVINDSRKLLKRLERKSYCRFCLNAKRDVEEFCYNSADKEHEFVVDIAELKKELIL